MAESVQAGDGGHAAPGRGRGLSDALERDTVTLAKVQIMYWKEIPVQVRAEDGSGQVSKPLNDRFQRGVDAISMFDGSSGSDEYLMAWEWGEAIEVEGTAQQAATNMADRLNQGFPQDFVQRIRDLHQADLRKPCPGAADHWLD